MGETRKLAAILVSDVVGYSRLAGADEDRILARLRTLRSDLIDPIIAVHHGRIVKRTGDGSIIEFRSVVDAVNCAVEIQRAMVERNAEVAPQKRIEFRVGIHLGDVVEEADGDLMGDGVNIAARLEGVCEPGGVCLSEDAYRQVKGRLDLAVTDLGPTQLRNIADPIRVYALRVGVPKQTKSPQVTRDKQRSRLLILIGVTVGFIAIAVGAWHLINPIGTNVNAPVSAGRPHLSLVVLPFKNLSNDSAQDPFADGVTENLTSELSRIRHSSVTARTTAAAYGHKTVDAREIGKDLDVRYILEGSIQRDQTRAHVNAQLVDAQSGAHIWADHFDENASDLFDFQSQVVNRLAYALRHQLIIAEAEKGAQSKSPDAIDLAMRGRALMLGTQPPTKEKNDAAIVLFEQALKIDPDESGAIAGLALAYGRSEAYRWNSGAGYAAKILELSRRAIELDPDNVAAYIAQAYYFDLNERWQDVIRAANAGLAIDPNSAALYAARAAGEGQVARYEENISDRQKAKQLKRSNPDPDVHYWEW